MNRSFLRILALALALVAAPALAERPAPKPKPPAPQPKTDPKTLVGPAKAQFIYAVGCEQRRTCDRIFLEDAEKRFLDACKACDSAERCETVRTAVRAGESARDVKLCE